MVDCGKTFAFAWYPKIHDIIGKDFVLSPEFVTEIGEISFSWCLELYPNRSVNSDFQDEGQCYLRLTAMNGINKKSIAAYFTADLSGYDLIRCPEKIYDKFEVDKYAYGPSNFVVDLFSCIPDEVKKYQGNRIKIFGEITIHEEAFIDSEYLPISEEVKSPIFRKMVRNLFDNWMTATEKDVLSDLTIFCLLDGKRFRCHRFVLFAQSDVFKTMFENENCAENAELRILTLPDIDGTCMEEVLRYLYTGNLSQFSSESALQCLYAAEKYNLTALKSECETILRKSIDLENVCEILVAADKCHMQTLLDHVLRFVRLNYDSLKSTEEWKSFVCQHSSLLQLVVESFHQASVVKCYQVI